MNVKHACCTNMHYFVGGFDILHDKIPRPARAVQTRAASYGIITFFTIY